MQFPENALKCNKRVHLADWVSFLCLLGDSVVIWVWFSLYHEIIRDMPPLTHHLALATCGSFSVWLWASGIVKFREDSTYF